MQLYNNKQCRKKLNPIQIRDKCAPTEHALYEQAYRLQKVFPQACRREEEEKTREIKLVSNSEIPSVSNKACRNITVEPSRTRSPWTRLYRLCKSSQLKLCLHYASFEDTVCIHMVFLQVVKLNAGAEGNTGAAQTASQATSVRSRTDSLVDHL